MDSHGGIRPLNARQVQPFHSGPTPGNSSKTPTSITSCGSDVDEINNISKGRHLKRCVKTKIGDKV
jgi:hypothetical protein